MSVNPIMTAINLIFSDEPIKALEFVKDQEGPEFRNIQKKLEDKLDHILNYETYLKKYRDDPMDWKPEGLWNERYRWIFKNIQKQEPKNYIDLGCYEGTLVKKIAETLGIPSIGVEISKAAVKYNNSVAPKGAKFIQSGIEEFRSDMKFDAVVCMEVIEHVAEPKKLVETMKSLMHEDSYGYLTTPKGCYDVACTIRIWETPGIHFDHVRTYTPESLAEEIGTDRVVIYEHEGQLLAKFQLPTGGER